MKLEGEVISDENSYEKVRNTIVFVRHPSLLGRHLFNITISYSLGVMGYKVLAPPLAVRHSFPSFVVMAWAPSTVSI